MENIPTIDEAVEHYKPENSDPIDWSNDDDSVLLSKINARISDAKGIHSKKCKEWKEADDYLDGDPSASDPTKEKLLYNPLFPIVRNMTGLITDSKPNPSVRLVDIGEEVSEEEREKMRQTADNLSVSLEEWWDDIRGQSQLQKWIFGLWVYSDYYVMPYWDNKIKEAMLEAIRPTRVRIDPNADDVNNADYAIVDFYRSKKWMWSRYGQAKAKDLIFQDYSEARLNDDTGEVSNELMKNVCKVQLYMETDWWVYKSGNKILEKIRNPLWALDEDGQKSDIENSVRAKYEKPGIGGMIDKGVNAVKRMVGLENNDDKIAQELEGVMMNFVPKVNYLKYPKIPLVQFDTYRLSGDLYSKSTVKQTIGLIDDLNDRKMDIQNNSESVGKPTTFLDGKVVNDEQAKRVESGRANGEVVRMNTGDNKPLSSSIFIAQGVPLPQQFFNNIETNKRDIDNIWGHHEVSRGGSDPANKTKGGILALQEADQTPIRYVTRNIEDSLQEIFELVIQIRKLFKPGKYSLEAGGSIDYNIIDQHFKVFMKSGSMMPVSKEAQRDESLELWKLNAIDPLTLYEKLNFPDPEKTAKRLEMWIREKTIMTDDMDEQQTRVLDKIKLIQANRFGEVVIGPDDDPKTHSDMLAMALKSNQFSPEQEQFIAQLVQQYDAMAQQSAPEEVPV